MYHFCIRNTQIFLLNFISRKILFWDPKTIFLGCLIIFLIVFLIRSKQLQHNNKQDNNRSI